MFQFPDISSFHGSWLINHFSKILRYHSFRKANCESIIRQQENQYMLQDGDLDQSQYAGIHSGS
jgi:hypothetical protein